MILLDLDYLQPISNKHQLMNEVSGAGSEATVITEALPDIAISMAAGSSTGDITNAVVDVSTNSVSKPLFNYSTATGSVVTFGITTSNGISVTAAVDAGVSASVTTNS